MPRFILPKPATVLDINVSLNLSGPADDMRLKPVIDVQIIEDEIPGDIPGDDPGPKPARFDIHIKPDNRNVLLYA